MASMMITMRKQLAESKHFSFKLAKLRPGYFKSIAGNFGLMRLVSQVRPHPANGPFNPMRLQRQKLTCSTKRREILELEISCSAAWGAEHFRDRNADGRIKLSTYKSLFK